MSFYNKSPKQRRLFVMAVIGWTLFALALLFFIVGIWSGDGRFAGTGAVFFVGAFALFLAITVV